MRAILIDPVKKVVTEVEYSGDFNQIYELIHASCFTMAGRVGRDSMYVDDEGLFDPKFGWFKWVSYPTPLAGYGLLMGTDRAGETVAAVSKIEDLEVEFGIIGKMGDQTGWLTNDGKLSVIPE